MSRSGKVAGASFLPAFLPLPLPPPFFKFLLPPINLFNTFLCTCVVIHICDYLILPDYSYFLLHIYNYYDISILSSPVSYNYFYTPLIPFDTINGRLPPLELLFLALPLFLGPAFDAIPLLPCI